MKQLLILPGDGIGHEITQGTQRVLEHLIVRDNLAIQIEHASVGGTAYEQTGVPLPAETLAKARAADAILLGAVGGPQWENLDISVRPEIALLGLRKELGLFANFRPAILYPQLANASTLKKEIVADLDILILRELTGGIYFGQPRGVEVNADGERFGYNTYVYNESEIRRIAYVAFDSARKRQSKVCSVDKANVLEVTELWRQIVTEVATEYPDVELSHMYVDNAVMQLIRDPKQFDVILTGNMFGDILSDAAAMLTGSIGMLPSASLNANKQGMYEPVHGSAPDIAGQDIANPLATILSLAMLFRFSFDLPEQALAIEQAVSKVLSDGYRTADIYQAEHEIKLGTEAMAQAVIDAL